MTDHERACLAALLPVVLDEVAEAIAARRVHTRHTTEEESQHG